MSSPPAKRPCKSNHVTRKDNYSFSGRQSDVRYTETPHSVIFRVRIDGIPRPAYRSRARKVENPRPNSKGLAFYDPSKNDKDSFNAAIDHALRILPQPIALLDTATNPLHLSVNFYRGRPLAHYQWSTLTHSYKLKPTASVYHSQKPDIDNLLKLVMDGFTNRVYGDDATVSSITTKKVWWAPNDPIFTANQDKKGFTLILLRQIKAGTTQDGCNCDICNLAR